MCEAHDAHLMVASPSVMCATNYFTANRNRSGGGGVFVLKALKDGQREYLMKPTQLETEEQGEAARGAQGVADQEAKEQLGVTGRVCAGLIKRCSDKSGPSYIRHPNHENHSQCH